MTADPLIAAPAAPPGSHESRLWPRVAIVVWLLAYLGLCGRTLLLRHDAHSVYPVFTTAADHWLHGQELFVRGGAEEFRYSPLVAAAFVPFDLMPPRLGQFLWRSLNFAALVLGLWWCARVGLPRRLSPNQLAAMFLLVLPIAAGSLNNAQSNPLVIGLLLIATAAVLQRRWWTCAIAIAVATLFKIYPLSLGLLLLLIYPRRLGWRLAVCLAVGLLLPLALQRVQYVMHEYHVWVRYLATEDRQRGPIADWYKDFRAVWRLYVGPMSANTYRLVELAAAGIIAVVVLAGRLQHWPRRVLLAITLSLACCWMTPLGPGTESSTYILIAPAAAWALVEADQQPRAHLRRIGYGVAFGLLLASQAALWFGAGGKMFRDRLQPLPIAGMLLLVMLLVDATWLLFATQDSEVATALPVRREREGVEAISSVESKRNVQLPTRLD